MSATPHEILAEEMGAVAARIERELRQKADLLIHEIRNQLLEAELKFMRLESSVRELMGTVKDGEPGPRGEQGERGLPGEVGERGEQGERGLQGERGEPGQPGEKGEKGDPGERGEKGERGQDGEKGETGEQGPRGETGERGARGEQGAPGEKGEQGERGLPGADGQDGAPGERGDQGEPGQPGERGEPGQPGRDGEVGPRGEPGRDGADGRDGAPGERGEPGKDGKLPVVKQWTAEGVHYEGDVVTSDGSTYQALRDTGQAPPHADWACLASRGADAYAGEVKGLYDPEANYRAMDIVTKDDCEWRAVYDNPGSLPGPGWRRGAGKGKPGQKGERGESGPKGEQGSPGISFLAWRVEPKGYTATPIMSDGSEGEPLQLRSVFEQFLGETGKD